MGNNWLYTDMFCHFQKWRKELAKNREKLLGGSDKDKEKDKKTTDKEKEEKKEKKEVRYLLFVRHFNDLTPKTPPAMLSLVFHMCLEKEEREEEIQQGEERLPVFGWPAVPQYCHIRTLTHLQTHNSCPLRWSLI